MEKRIIAIRLSDELYFIVKHINSRRHNDYQNQIIDCYQLFDEIMGYASNSIICLEEIIEIKDINNEIIDYMELYDFFNSVIIMNKLSSIKPLFIKQNLILKG